MSDLNKVWGGPLSGNSFVVVVINRFDVEKQILMNWREDAMVPAGVYSVQVRDVLSHQGSLIIGRLLWSQDLSNVRKMSPP